MKRERKNPDLCPACRRHDHEDHTVAFPKVVQYKGQRLEVDYLCRCNCNPKKNWRRMTDA